MSPREPTVKPEGCVSVFVGNLAWDVDEDAIRAAFQGCGEIAHVRLSTDRETGDFKGFGHIDFANSDSTDAAVKMAGTEICGRAIRVDYAVDKRAGGGGRGGGRGGNSFGSGGRGSRGSFGGGGGRGGRGGGRGGGGDSVVKAKKSGGIAGFAGKKITFD